MIHIGVDPGLHGAIALLDPAGALICVADLPVISDRALKWIDGGELQSILLAALEGRPATAMIERVSAMPKQGVASSFQFGGAADGPGGHSELRSRNRGQRDAVCRWRFNRRRSGAEASVVNAEPGR